MERVRPTARSHVHRRHHPHQHLHERQLSVPPHEGLDRYSTVPVYEQYRARLRDGSYINASEIDFGPGYPAYIATQAPFPGTVASLLRLAFERRARAIVALEKRNPYWDLEGNEAATCTHDLGGGRYACFVPGPRSGHKRLIYFDAQGNPEFTTQMLYTTTWPDGTVPEPSETPKLAYILDAAGYGPSSANFGPIIVHCAAGVARSATVVASHHAVARILAGAAPGSARSLVGEGIELFESRRVMNATPAQIGYAPDLVRAALALRGSGPARRAARAADRDANPYAPLGLVEA